jgi:hypothetical protein
MQHEHQPLSRRSVFAETFGLSEREELFDHFGEARLRALLEQPETQVHSAQVDSNSFGEFLFITLSREYRGKRLYLTCYGLGYHEARERWLQGVWFFYPTTVSAPRLAQTLPKAQVEALLTQRRAEVAAWARDATAPSERALLFGLLADVTDEDGAYIELEDMEDLIQSLDDEPE